MGNESKGAVIVERMDIILLSLTVTRSGVPCKSKVVKIPVNIKPALLHFSITFSLFVLVVKVE